MRLRFQAEADLNERDRLRYISADPDIDFQTAEEAELWGMADPEVLARAADENRILVTHDRRTMPRHSADFIGRRACPGVIVISQRVSVHRAIEELTLTWEASAAEEWSNLIVELPL